MDEAIGTQKRLKCERPMLTALLRDIDSLRAAVAGRKRWKHGSGADYWEERLGENFSVLAGRLR